MLAVVVSADGTPESLREAGSPVATFAVSRVGGARARRRSRHAPNGCGVRRARSRRSTASTRAAARRLVDAALAASDDVWLDPAATRAHC